jgi:predicted MFS family arabinose efflux permease
MSAISAPAPRRAAVPLALIIVAGCILIAVGNGVRNSFGLFTLPVTAELGLSREEWGLAMAIQNLVWGITQPFAGEFAERFGTAKTVVFGLLLYAAGIALMVVSPNAMMLDLSAGLIAGTGISISSVSVIMAAFGRSVPPEKRSFYFGIATAASSFGQFAFAPISQGFISAFGWQTALLWLAAILVIVIPLTSTIRGRTENPAGHVDIPFWTALRRAWGHGSYRLLVIGFFVCGFHVAFITVHMPAYLVQCGLSPAVGSWSLALLGLFNIVGSLSTGYLGTRVPKQMVLAVLYLGRAIAIGIFMLFPVAEVTAYTFSIAMGLLWLSTVPPTAGLVTTFFGPRYMGMLYGFAFFSHQVGSFFGVWLGGIVYDQTGSYALIWYAGILLGLAAAAIHLPIRDARDMKFQPAAA